MAGVHRQSPDALGDPVDFDGAVGTVESEMRRPKSEPLLTEASWKELLLRAVKPIVAGTPGSGVRL